MTTPAPPHTCPICGRAVERRPEAPRPAAFPFCSPACKLVDLGRWLDGGYRIPGPPTDDVAILGGEDE